MKKIMYMFCMVLLSLIPFDVRAHGVDIRTIGGGTGIQAVYDSGEPIGDAGVEVYSPSEKEVVFQAGATDRNGRFLFFPDSPGEWKIVINDGTGHGGIKYIRIESVGHVPEGDGGVGPDRSMKVLSGISVIFGLTGVLFFIMAVRERKRGGSAHT